VSPLIDFILDFGEEEYAYNLLWFLEGAVYQTLEDGPFDDFPLEGVYSYVFDTAILLKHVEGRLSGNCECHAHQVHFDVLDSGPAFILCGSLENMADMYLEGGEKELSEIYLRLHEQMDSLMEESNGRV